MYDLDTLAHNIAAFGIDRFETEVQAIADHAFRRGISPTMAALVADSTAPTVARERAYARLVAALAKEPTALSSVA